MHGVLRPKPAGLLASLLVALALVAAVPSSAVGLGGPYNGGWQTTANWQGINGYINQTLTASTSSWHLATIGLFPSDRSWWVETGTYQGVHLPYLNSPGAVRVFVENLDGCGDYYLDDGGARPAADFPYSVNWDGSSSVILCSNGTHKGVYDYPVRKGGVTTTPWFDATGKSTATLAYVKTELTSQGMPEGLDWFGCTSSLTCQTSAYGIHLYNGSTWSLWGSGTATLGEDAPPWVFTYNYHWSFKTCPTSC